MAKAPALLALAPCFFWLVSLSPAIILADSTDISFGPRLSVAHPLEGRLEALIAQGLFDDWAVEIDVGLNVTKEEAKAVAGCRLAGLLDIWTLVQCIEP